VGGQPPARGLPAPARSGDPFCRAQWPVARAGGGGSLGARALNEVVPKALALLPPDQRPRVLHQSGAKQIDELRAHYAEAGVTAELTPFIDDTAQAFADADLVICRAGASTVTELAAVGVAALFVPFPAAVDDHQTTNAQFLVAAGAGWLVPQRTLTPRLLRYATKNRANGALAEGLAGQIPAKTPGHGRGGAGVRELAS